MGAVRGGGGWWWYTSNRCNYFPIASARSRRKTLYLFRKSALFRPARCFRIADPRRESEAFQITLRENFSRISRRNSTEKYFRSLNPLNSLSGKLLLRWTLQRKSNYHHFYPRIFLLPSSLGICPILLGCIKGRNSRDHPVLHFSFEAECRIPERGLRRQPSWVTAASAISPDLPPPRN